MATAALLQLRSRSDVSDGDEGAARDAAARSDADALRVCYLV